MGKWDSAASTNLSLQFGSFSLNGVEHVEATSPRGWASTTTTTTTTSSTNGGKTVTKATTTQSAWANSAKAASPKKTATLSPGRALDSEQRHTLEGAAAAVVAKTTTSAPPGLSVDSGRVTPTSAQSPRYTPSAPSPASLPKPDEVKRGTPTRAQGGPFQAQGGAAAQSSKMNIGYGSDFGGAKPSGLYQASYGHPRTQYPPRGNMPYGVEGPVPGFSNPPNMPVGYQDQHLMAQQHEYAGAVPQGFGEISGAYLQQAPMQQQQGGHHGHHGHQQTGPQSHGKSGSGAAAGAAGSQQSHGQRSNSGMQGYQNASQRDHASSPPTSELHAPGRVAEMLLSS
ncbi:hypothetical protein BBJ28_00019858 [Nothophytophthora sp. Chile5]|nr:hypothetical protein BBJ28_00019858 [Nothophytophthora sp. Chile5]